MGKVARLFLGPDFGISGFTGIGAPALGGMVAMILPILRKRCAGKVGNEEICLYSLNLHLSM